MIPAPSDAGPGLSASLRAHPDSPDLGVHAMEVTLAWCGRDTLVLTYDLDGAIDRIRIPPRADSPARRDGLWQHTCFELFVAGEGSAAYCEFNFAPSGDWAAYAFSDYRERVPSDDVPAPRIVVVREARRFEQRVSLSAVALPPECREVPTLIGASAVIESADGRRAYWAASHPPGKPDFHHRAAFSLRLPPPRSPVPREAP